MLTVLEKVNLYDTFGSSRFPAKEELQEVVREKIGQIVSGQIAALDLVWNKFGKMLLLKDK